MTTTNLLGRRCEWHRRYQVSGDHWWSASKWQDRVIYGEVVAFDRGQLALRLDDGSLAHAFMNEVRILEGKAEE